MLRSSLEQTATWKGFHQQKNSLMSLNPVGPHTKSGCWLQLQMLKIMTAANPYTTNSESTYRQQQIHTLQLQSKNGT